MANTAGAGAGGALPEESSFLEHEDASRLALSEMIGRTGPHHPTTNDNDVGCFW